MTQSRCTGPWRPGRHAPTTTLSVDSEVLWMEADQRVVVNYPALKGQASTDGSGERHVENLLRDSHVEHSVQQRNSVFSSERPDVRRDILSAEPPLHG